MAKSVFNLMRRLPPNQVAKSLAGIGQLIDRAVLIGGGEGFSEGFAHLDPDTPMEQFMPRNEGSAGFSGDIVGNQVVEQIACSEVVIYLPHTGVFTNGPR